MSCSSSGGVSVPLTEGESGAVLSWAEQVVSAARERGLRIAVAESLTGGLVAGALCGVPGASAVFTGAVVCYTHEVKSSVLGVDRGLLAIRGAVDAEVARQMAVGALRVCEADLAVSTTGAAGPEPHDGQPVGTVFFGLAGAGGERTVQGAYQGDRAVIREASVRGALELLLEQLRALPQSG